MLAACGEKLPGVYEMVSYTAKNGEETYSMTRTEYQEKLDLLENGDLGIEEEAALRMELELAELLFEGTPTLEFKEDGTVVVTELAGEDGESTTSTATWTQDGEKVTITIEGEDEPQEYTFKDGKLSISMPESFMGECTLVFAKKN